MITSSVWTRTEHTVGINGQNETEIEVESKETLHSEHIVHLLEGIEGPITSVIIHDASKISAGGLCALGLLGEQLKRLKINQMIRSTYEHGTWLYPILKSCPNIREISLECSYFPERTVAYLTVLGKNIERLDLTEFPAEDSLAEKMTGVNECRMTDSRFITIIDNLPKLKSLELVRFSKLTFEGLSEIKRLTNLEVLTLDGMPTIDDKLVFHVLGGCKSIKFLRLTASKITKLGLGSIFQLQNLRGLNLDECKNIESEDILLLSEHESLQSISMRRTKLDNRFLMNPSPILKRIMVTGSLVTTDAVNTFRSLHTDIKIENEDVKKSGWSWKLWG